jgi:hypothetical protein
MVLPTLLFGLLDSRGAEDWDGSTFYFGDLHAHTGVSPDGGSTDVGTFCDAPCGATAEAFATARSNGLDFVAFTDHLYSSRDAFDAFQQEVATHNDPSGGFLTIPAAEANFGTNDGHAYGHKNAFVFNDDDSAVVPTLADFPSNGNVRGCDEIWEGAARLSKAGPTLLFAHHPAVKAPMPTDWSCHDQTYEPVVEVISEHGNSLEPSTDYHPVRDYTEGSDVHAALETYGLELGFVGGTDNHMAQPGSVCGLDTMKLTFPYGGALTMIALPEGAAFTRRAIYDELVARRSLVTTGPRMPVSVRWALGDETVAGIGEDLRIRADEAIQLTVSIPPKWAPVVNAVRLVGYEDRIAIDELGSGVWSSTIDALDLGRWRYVEVELDHAAVYDDTCQDGDEQDPREFVWASPDWFVLTDDVDMDGVAVPEDCDDDDATIFPGAVDTWYDGVDQDCDGASDFDADGDGADAMAYGGTDCDDTSADIYPGAVEILNDGIDQDCDGLNDDSVVDAGDSAPSSEPSEQRDAADESSGGCAHGKGAQHPLWLLVLGLLAARRRSR